MEPGNAKTSAVAQANPSASLHQWGWSTFRIGRSLMPPAKQRADAAGGSPGVIRDGRRRKIDQEPERPGVVTWSQGVTPDQ